MNINSITAINYTDGKYHNAIESNPTQNSKKEDSISLEEKTALDIYKELMINRYRKDIFTETAEELEW